MGSYDCPLKLFPMTWCDICGIKTFTKDPRMKCLLILEHSSTWEGSSRDKLRPVKKQTWS